MRQFICFRTVGKRLGYGLSLAALIGLFAGATATSALAQGAVGSTRGDFGMGTGTHTIKGTIYLADGSPIASHQFKVALEGTDQVTRYTTSDIDGGFSFSSVPAGNWSVVIEGTSEYEAAREPSPIDRSAGSPVNIVALFLRRKPASDPAFAGVPKGAIDAYVKGMQAVDKKDDKKALEQFNKAIAEYPNFAQALTEVGTIYLKQGDLDKAAENLKKAVELKPDSFDAHYNYGYVLLNKKDMPGAETEFRAAVKIREASAKAHMNLGIALVSQKKYDEARDEFEKAVNLPNGEELWQAHKYLGGLYMASDPKRAADELDKYLKLQPKAPDAERIRGTVKELRAKPGTSSGGGAAN